ncbi:hypothetical protein HanXRQr2_Chr02g0050721 [Helianthus annuus]|uniref:Uncharacterized protein n=1 Tax=Helianthus annuus TaxID=4232 RepID=A0A251VE42_HELAN|nr:hypothetical protein HanXRQr2_Chr02g0050721 [Helianthus annuus]
MMDHIIISCRNVTKHSRGHMIFFWKEAPKVSLEDYTTLLNIKHCTLRDQATNHSLQKLYSTFKEDGHTSLKGYMLK